jgi:hypothetical protein
MQVDQVMKLPNYQQAVIDITKLRRYCLNPEHATGKHKARVFKSALGIDLSNPGVLVNAFVCAIETHEACYLGNNEYGEKYTVDFNMEYQTKQAMIRTVWIVKYSECFPRLITCHVI